MILEPSLDEHFNKVRRMVRSSIAKGFPHHNDPAPGAAILRDLLDTTVILSRDHETGVCPASKGRQVTLCSAHFSKILNAANVYSQDVVRVQMLLRDFGASLPINPHWFERTPDPQCWPTRHAIRSEGSSIQMVATAISTEG